MAFIGLPRPAYEHFVQKKKEANQSKSKYFHLSAWKDDSLIECLKHFEPPLSIQPDSCIYSSCKNEVKYITNEQFIPG